MRSKMNRVAARCLVGTLVALPILAVFWVKGETPTNAQQSDQRGDRSTLITQIVEAQAAIDLMQLEHDADREHLVKNLSQLRDFGVVDPQRFEEAAIVNYLNEPIEPGQQNGESTKSAKELFKKGIDELGKYIQSRKENYHEASIVLHRKKIELESLLKRYHAAH